MKAKELLAKEGAKREAGAQEGHAGTGRRVAPEDQVDEIVAHYPQECRGCGHEFTLDERSPGGRFGRHQVAELPPISVVLVEHRTHRITARSAGPGQPPRCRRVSATWRSGRGCARRS